MERKTIRLGEMNAQECALALRVLHTICPWLGTEHSVSGADVVEAINDASETLHTRLQSFTPQPPIPEPAEWEMKAPLIASCIHVFDRDWDVEAIDTGGGVMCVVVSFDVLEFSFGDAAETVQGTVRHEGKKLRGKKGVIDTGLSSNQPASLLAERIVAHIDAWLNGNCENELKTLIREGDRSNEMDYS